MLHISNGRYGLTSTCGDSRPDSNPIESRAVRDGTMTAYSARKDRARDRPPRSDVRR